MHWALRFWLGGQLLMLMLAPLVGHVAARLLYPDYMAFSYTVLAVMLWPMAPMCWVLVFRPETI